MNETEKQLILDAIDAAFKTHVNQMFGTLVTGLIAVDISQDTRAKVFARFEKGINLLLDARTSARTYWEDENGLL